MINLIPPTAHSQVKREYWVRVVSVWMLTLGTAFFILALLNAPVYVLVRSQLKSFQEAYNQAGDNSQSFAESELAITHANEIAKLLTLSGNATPFSRIITELEILTGEGVDISDFTFARENGVVTAIVIVGEADSRLLLAEFRDALEGSPLFETATLPLSNLAKDRDIPFSITIVPSKEIK